MTHTIRDIIQAGQQAWPHISVDDDVVATWLAQRSRDDEPSDLGEVFIAIAIANGDSPAIKAFEDAYFTSLPGVLRRMGLRAHHIDDIKQTLRTRLYIPGTETAPRVLDYAGKGRLQALVRVAAVRVGLNLLRDEKRITDADDDWLVEQPDDNSDPRLAHLKNQYRSQLKQAFENAARELAPRQRTLLRLHWVENLSIDDIGAVYRVHRSTAARWLVKARDELLETSRTGFLKLADLRDDAIADLATFIESQLSLSLSRVLQTGQP